MKPKFVDMSINPWAYDNPIAYVFGSMFGYNQYKSTEASTKAQISYNDYIKRGNARALEDWNKNLGKYGLTIKYPELSYAGRMYQADTGSYRAGLDSYTASANYYGNIPYRAAGLYGVGSRLSRWL